MRVRDGPTARWCVGWPWQPPRRACRPALQSHSVRRRPTTCLRYPLDRLPRRVRRHRLWIRRRRSSRRLLGDRHWRTYLPRRPCRLPDFRRSLLGPRLLVRGPAPSLQDWPIGAEFGCETGGEDSGTKGTWDFSFHAHPPLRGDRSLAAGACRYWCHCGPRRRSHCRHGRCRHSLRIPRYCRRARRRPRLRLPYRRRHRHRRSPLEHLSP